jgi:hypothetical protein
MISSNKPQKGQALILIALGIVGLVGITALAIDGGNAFSERRRAQNAADTAALAGALAKSQGSNNVVAYAAADNYVNLNMTGDSVIDNLIIISPPGVDCKGNSNGPYLDPLGNNISYQYIQVLLRITVKTYFAQVVGRSETKSCVEAIARAKYGYQGPLFFGNAVVGLNPNGTSYLAQSNSQWWIIKGGGIFSNNNAIDKHGQVTFPDGNCVTAVDTATGFIGCTPSQNQTALKYAYPDDILPLLPQYNKPPCDLPFCPPPCDGVVKRGDGTVNYPDPSLLYPADPTKKWSGSRVDHFEDKYAPGLYCIEDAGGVITSTVTGNGVTFYFLDQDFTMKYAGGGSLDAQAPTDPLAGPYQNYLMFSDVTPDPCTQNMELRGNGTSPIIGTIFLPSACINYLGNSNGSLNFVQLIGYQVYSNGTSALEILFNANDQAEGNNPAEVELYK